MIEPTVVEIITAIRHCVEEAGKNPQPVRDEDFLLEARGVYNVNQPQSKKTFLVKDYAPNVFRDLREMFGAPDEAFLKSWTIPEDATMTQSTARSGSYFYKTPDKKYLFKTILHPEVGVLMNLLQNYHKHIKTYPKSFMVKIYGLFRVNMGAPKWILIMGNAFPPAIQKFAHIYDLKGRRPKPGKSLEERGVISSAARKDNELGHKILFEPKDKEFYLQQLLFDIELLKIHNIMDYSLLIGIYKVTPEDKEIRQKRIEKESKKQKKEKRAKSTGSTNGKMIKSLTLTSSDVTTTTAAPNKAAANLKPAPKNRSNTLGRSPRGAQTARELHSSTPNAHKRRHTYTIDDESNKPVKNKESALGATKKSSTTESPSDKQRKRPVSMAITKTKTSESDDHDLKKDLKKDAKKDKLNKKIAEKDEKSNDTDNTTDDDKDNNGGNSSNNSDNDKPKQKKSSPKAKKPKVEEKGKEKLRETGQEEVGNIQVPALEKEDKEPNDNEEAKKDPVASLKQEGRQARRAQSFQGIQTTKKTSPKKKKPKQKTDSSQNISVWDYGALHAKDPETGDEELIFLSIIDNLTAYTFGKQLAHFFKKFLWDTHTLSTVRAEFYAQRFTEFMTKNLLADEEEVEMPSDEEADFNEHIEKLVRDGKAPPPRNGKNKGLPASEKTKTTKTTTTTITTTTTTTTTTKRNADDDTDNNNNNNNNNTNNNNVSGESGSKKEDEEKEKNKATKKQKSLQIQIESDTAEKPQEVMSARVPANKKPKQKPQRRSSRS